MGNMRNMWKILGGTPEGKSKLGRPKHRWKDTIKTHLKNSF
jgi:hypothetical protein